MNILSLASKNILLELSDYTLWITLNRPESSNAYSEEMISEFVRVLDSVNKCKEMRVVVITGAGKHFCAGGDLKSMQTKSGMFAGEANELRIRYQEGIQQISVAIESISKPIIAMINGAAIGAGLDLACMCDIRLCAENAVFAESFTKLGLVPGDGGSFFLQRVVGYAKAMEMSLTAETYTSSEALAMGLVSKVVPQDQLRELTTKWAQTIASRAPIATELTKKAIKSAYHSDVIQNLDLVASFQAICQRSNDHFRAINSFLNKTHPTFEGD